MAQDPGPALAALVQDKLDPRAVSQWITAYLGKRSPREKRLALQTLRMEFESRRAAEPRSAGLVVRVIEKLLAELE